MRKWAHAPRQKGENAWDALLGSAKEAKRLIRFFRTSPTASRHIARRSGGHGEEKRRFRGEARGGGSIPGSIAVVRTFPAGVKRRFRAGKISDRPWAEGFATGSTAASGIIHKEPASSAYGRSDIFPPMNRRNPVPRRMVRGYGSRGGTRGSDYPLNRLFSFSLGTHEARGRFSNPMLLAQSEKCPGHAALGVLG